MTQIADIEVSRGNAKVASGVLLLLGILLFLNYGVARLSDLLAYQMWPSHVDMFVFIVIGSAILYVVLMALPFMPGIEVGLMLMAMLGVGGIVLVYLCTVLALSLSFLAGRLLPPRYVARALGWLRLERARKLVTELEPLGAKPDSL
jgi:hypothetical protein